MPNIKTLVEAAPDPWLENAAPEVNRTRPDICRVCRAGMHQIEACELSAVQVQLLASRYGLVAHREVVAGGTPHLAAVDLEPSGRGTVGIVRIAHGDIVAADGSVVDHNLVRRARRARPLIADNYVTGKRQLAAVDLQFRRTGLLPRRIHTHRHVCGIDRAAVERQLRPQRLARRRRRGQTVVVADVDSVREFQQSVVHHEFAKGLRRTRRLRRARRNVEEVGRLDRRCVCGVVHRTYHNPAVRNV